MTAHVAALRVRFLPRTFGSAANRPEAKVTIINFDDLECGYCARMHQELFPATLEHYKDMVRFVYKDDPLTEIHPWAMHAAVDANCLAAQSTDVYWTYVDYLHAHGDEVNGDGSRPEEELRHAGPHRPPGGDAGQARFGQSWTRAWPSRMKHRFAPRPTRLRPGTRRHTGHVYEWRTDCGGAARESALDGDRPRAARRGRAAVHRQQPETLRRLRKSLQAPASSCRPHKFAAAQLGYGVDMPIARGRRGFILKCRGSSGSRGEYQVASRRFLSYAHSFDFCCFLLRDPADGGLAAASRSAVSRRDGDGERQGNPARRAGEVLQGQPREIRRTEPSAEQADIVRLNILRQMIDDEILQQRAAKLNLAASDEDVNAKLTEMKAPYTQEEFDKQLKQRNLTIDDLKRDLRRQLTKDQAAEQGDRVEDQHHRRRDHELLQRAQGGVQPD